MTKEESNDIAPRIYVASLADYNAGHLLGKWIDACQPVEAIHAEIQAMLATSEESVAEEWAIHDYEGFGTLRLSEYTPIEYVAELAQRMKEHGLIFAELACHMGAENDLEEPARYLREGYLGTFDLLSDYGRQYVESIYGDGLPDFIRYNINYEAIGRDFELSGDIFTLDCGGKIHVFKGNI